VISCRRATLVPSHFRQQNCPSPFARITQAASYTRDIVDLAPDAFFEADLDARFTDVDDAACEMLGYARDELIGKTIFDIIPAEGGGPPSSFRSRSALRKTRVSHVMH